MVGHRGNPELHPDNTLAGVMSGLTEVGAVEVDVRLSMDGHLVLAHDPFLADLEIGSSRWEHLADIDLGHGHRPCQLDDVLALGGSIALEVKNAPWEVGFDPHGRLALLVASRAGPGDVVIGFHWPDMDLIGATAPQVPTGLLVGRDGSAFDALRHAVEAGHRMVAPHHTLVDRELSKAAAGEGVALMAWTVNGVDRAVELSLLDVAAIISDHPAVIERALG